MKLVRRVKRADNVNNMTSELANVSSRLFKMMGDAGPRLRFHPFINVRSLDKKTLVADNGYSQSTYFIFLKWCPALCK